MKLCSETQSNNQTQIEMYLTKFDDNNPQPKQDLYISGNYVGLDGIGEGSLLTFDQVFLGKIKTALKFFRRCFQQNGKTCQIEGLNLDVKTEKKLTILLKEGSDGGLEVSNVRIESLFSRKRRAAVPKTARYIPVVCRDPNKFKCWGSTRVTLQPKLSKMKNKAMKKNTFVHIKLKVSSKKFARTTTSTTTSSTTTRATKPNKKSSKQPAAQRFVVHFNTSVPRKRRTITWPTVRDEQKQFPKCLKVFKESLDALTSL